MSYNEETLVYKVSLGDCQLCELLWTQGDQPIGWMDVY